MALSIPHGEGVALSIPDGERMVLFIPDGEGVSLSISHKVVCTKYNKRDS